MYQDYPIPGIFCSELNHRITARLAEPKLNVCYGKWTNEGPAKTWGWSRLERIYIKKPHMK